MVVMKVFKICCIFNKCFNMTKIGMREKGKLRKIHFKSSEVNFLENSIFLRQFCI